MASTRNQSEPAQQRCEPRLQKRVPASGSGEEGLEHRPSLTSIGQSLATLANEPSGLELSVHSLQWLYGMATQSVLHWMALEAQEHAAQKPELSRSRALASLQIAEIAGVIECLGVEPRIPAALRSWRLVPSRMTELQAIAQLHEVRAMIAEILRRIPDQVN